MTLDQIDQFARAIGEVYDAIADPAITPTNYRRALAAVEVIKPLIEAAIAAEREQCAKIAETGVEHEWPGVGTVQGFGSNPVIAAAIRARRQ